MLRQALLALAIGCTQAVTDCRAAEFDDEHIFGFTEGTAIGHRGEREIENTLTGRLGRPGSYAALFNETAFRYGVTDSLRFAAGVLLDYHAVSGVPDLDDTTALNFGGITTELRWQVLRFDSAPIGLAFSAAPQWQRIDNLSAQHIESYAVPFTLFADKQLLDERLFVAFNFTVNPTFSRFADQWRREVPMEASVAGSFALGPRFFLGMEVRHLNHNLDGFLTGHSLFVGPSLYVGLAGSFSVKVAWARQIPDESTGVVDLVNYERDQFRLVLVKSF